MFTIEQITTAHNKVKSGADFPAYISELKKLGIKSYDSFVADGHTDYYGSKDYKISSQPKYETVQIAKIPNKEQFKADLLAHQQGKTDYPTFLNDCQKSGIYKWAISMEKMTCCYYDQKGNEVLTENIPQLPEA